MGKFARGGYGQHPLNVCDFFAASICIRSLQLVTIYILPTSEIDDIRLDCRLDSGEALSTEGQVAGFELQDNGFCDSFCLPSVFRNRAFAVSA